VQNFLKEEKNKVAFLQWTEPGFCLLNNFSIRALGALYESSLGCICSDSSNGWRDYFLFSILSKPNCANRGIEDENKGQSVPSPEGATSFIWSCLLTLTTWFFMAEILRKIGSELSLWLLPGFGYSEYELWFFLLDFDRCLLNRERSRTTDLRSEL